VFRRAGLVPNNARFEDYLHVARKLAPKKQVVGNEYQNTFYTEFLTVPRIIKRELVQRFCISPKAIILGVVVGVNFGGIVVGN
ncbi:MAG: hypothetical protein OXO49_09040, partial [Gammaproteobacteria bacterium]|nr:hypothetical protein [Gammaproteobacteria bacterium]MDE0252567.1 hypothetical protein [Gammaproteobacteria bacterium]MDE0403528.1 hypothetical protein [Gammaproteobacteria bacterium]